MWVRNKHTDNTRFSSSGSLTLAKVKNVLSMTVLNHGIDYPHQFETMNIMYSSGESVNVSSNLLMFLYLSFNTQCYYGCFDVYFNFNT